jgi:hypothetical protein
MRNLRALATTAFAAALVIGSAGIARAQLPSIHVPPLPIQDNGNKSNVDVDFRQCANNDKKAGPGNCSWINSILQQNNSNYQEGMSVPQRIILTGMSNDVSNHTLVFSHEATKNGPHAYDWLTSYDQAIKAASDAKIPYKDLNGQACDDSIGPKASTSECQSLRNGSNKISVDVPDDSYTSKDGSTQDRISAYENTYDNRTITLYGNTAMSNGSLTLRHISSNGSTLANGQDDQGSYIEYTLKWTSNSTNVLIELAGHLAETGSGGSAWPKGAAQINGAPYHFKLDTLDGESLGSRDNQIKATTLKDTTGHVPGGGSGGGTNGTPETPGTPGGSGGSAGSAGGTEVGGTAIGGKTPHTGPADIATVASGIWLVGLALAAGARRRRYD